MYKIFLLRISESYFRHRWLYLVPILLSAIFAGVYLTTITPKYISQGVVYINSDTLLSSLTALNNNDTNWWLTPAQASTNEISQLIGTDAFIRAVILKTDLEAKMNEGPDTVAAAIDYVRKNVWVFSQGDKQIQVNASDPNPVMAYQFVNSLIENYIQWKVNSERSDSVTAQDFFAQLVDQYGAGLETARDNLKKYLGEHPAPIRGDRPYLETLEIDRLNGEISIARDRYNNAVSKEEDAKLALQQTEAQTRERYVMIDAPAIPVDPNISLKKLAFNAGIFLAVGAFMSVLLIVGSTILDQSVRHPWDISSQLDLPVLAVIPDTSRKLGWRQRLSAVRIRRITEKSEAAGSEKQLEEKTMPDVEKGADAAL